MLAIILYKKALKQAEQCALEYVVVQTCADKEDVTDKMQRVYYQHLFLSKNLIIQSIRFTAMKHLRFNS